MRLMPYTSSEAQGWCMLIATGPPGFLPSMLLAWGPARPLFPMLPVPPPPPSFLLRFTVPFGAWIRLKCWRWHVFEVPSLVLSLRERYGSAAFLVRNFKQVETHHRKLSSTKAEICTHFERIQAGYDENAKLITPILTFHFSLSTNVTQYMIVKTCNKLNLLRWKRMACQQCWCRANGFYTSFSAFWFLQIAGRFLQRWVIAKI